MWTSRSIAVADSDGCWSLDVHFIADASHPLSCWPWQQPFAFPRNTCVWTSDGCTVMLQTLKASAMRGFYMPCGSKLTGDLHVAWTHTHYSCVACLGCILYCSTLFVSMHSSVVHSKPHVWAEIVRFQRLTDLGKLPIYSLKCHLILRRIPFRFELMWCIFAIL